LYTTYQRSSVIDFTSRMHEVPVTSNRRVLGLLNGQQEVTYPNRRATFNTPRVLFGYTVARWPPQQQVINLLPKTHWQNNDIVPSQCTSTHFFLGRQVYKKLTALTIFIKLAGLSAYLNAATP